MTTLETETRSVRSQRYPFPDQGAVGRRSAECSQALEAVASDCGKAPLKRLESLHLFFDWAYRLVTNDALLNAVEGILGGLVIRNKIAEPFQEGTPSN